MTDVKAHIKDNTTKVKCGNATKRGCIPRSYVINREFVVMETNPTFRVVEGERISEGVIRFRREGR